MADPRKLDDPLGYATAPPTKLWIAVAATYDNLTVLGAFSTEKGALEAGDGVEYPDNQPWDLFVYPVDLDVAKDYDFSTSLEWLNGVMATSDVVPEGEDEPKRVRIKVKPWQGQEGVLLRFNGAYNYIRLDSAEHPDDELELYPNEFEVI